MKTNDAKDKLSRIFSPFALPDTHSHIAGPESKSYRISKVTAFYIVLFFMLTGVQTFATTYYISPNGSNSANGDNSHPWQTLYYACTHATVPGDIIHVYAGNYIESNSCPLAPGVSIEGDGYFSHIVSTYAGSGIWDLDGAIKLISSNQGSNGNQSISGIRLDGNSLAAKKAIIVFKRSNVIIHDCHIENFNNNAITFYGSNFQTEPTSYSVGNKIYNDTIINCSSYESNNGFGNIEIQGQSGLQIYNNYIQQNSRAAGTNGYIIKGVAGYNKGLKIHDNTSIREYMSASGHYDIAYEFWQSMGGIEIYNNTINGGCIDIAGSFNVKGSYDYSFDIYENTIGMPSIINDGGIWTHCIDFEGSVSDVKVRNNLLKNTAIPIVFAHGQINLISERIYIYNNIINNVGSLNAGGGASIGILASASGSVYDSIFIRNNTFYDDGIGTDPYYGIWFWMTGTANNIFVQNNIFQGFTVAWLYTQLDGGNATIDNLYLQNNNSINNGNSNNPSYFQILPTNITNSGNIKVNPLFVSPGSDFHLQANSPCIDAGINVGLPYAATAPDLGAFEYSSGAGSTNQAPVIQNQSFQLNENSANNTTVGTVVAYDPNQGQTLTYSILSGNTNSAFAINSVTGAITVANSSALNYEAIPSFALTVKVQDNGAGSFSSQATITINLLNLNEAPSISNQTFSIPENSISGTLVGNVFASDPDAGQTLTYSIVSGNINNVFAIAPATGAITVANSSFLNFEGTPTYTLLIKVQDNGSGSLSAQAQVIVSLSNVNEPPLVNNQSFSVSTTPAVGTQVGTVIATDPDAGQTLTYSITSGNTNNAFSINSASGLITVNNTSAVNYQLNPVFSLTVKVIDNGNLFNNAIITINVLATNSNNAPIIGNQSFTVNENSSNGTIIGPVVASDPDAGQLLTYSIVSGNSGSAFTINSSTGILSVSNSTALNFETTPVFSLVIKVQDNGTISLNSQATITINLINLNEPPIISSQSFTVPENSTNGTLIGTVYAIDPDAGQTLTYSILSGNSSGTFAINSATGSLLVANSASLNFEATPSFSLTIKVQDNGNLSSQATIQVNLTNVNEPPTINYQSFSVIENSIEGTNIGNVIASDPDAGQSLTYSIISGNPDDAFGICMTTGNLYVANSFALDFETTPSFTLIVKVQDNGSNTLSSQSAITVNVVNVNEPPVVNDQNFSIINASVNGTIVGSVAAYDPDAGQNLTYSITAGNTGSAFTINNITGLITVNNSTAINYLINPVFSLNVRVADNGSGNLYDEATITINVTSSTINHAPVINSQSFTINENSSNGTSVGTVVASDPDAGQILYYSILSGNSSDAFSINSSTGLLTVNNSTALDYELTPTFSLVVKVMDNGVTSLSSQATITISLANLNEPPLFNNQFFSIPENSSNGTTVGTIAASDPDAGQTLTYSILSGNPNGAFAINASSGILTVTNSSVLNFETTPTFSLIIKVQDNGTTAMSTQAIITVGLNDINEPPVIGNQTFSVLENSNEGTILGNLIASDPDAGQSLTYSIISGNPDDAFGVIPSTGVLYVTNSLVLDYETTLQFSLTVKVQDNGSNNLSSQAIITVNVININEQPSIENQTFTTIENSGEGTIVGIVSASDPDAGQSLTYSIISGNPDDAFGIMPLSGKIYVTNSMALDYETTHYFSLTVRVQDNGSNTLYNQAIMIVNLTNLNEPPAISNQNFSISNLSANGTAVGTVVATDPDAGQTLAYSIRTGNAGNAFSVNSTTGLITVNNSSAINYLSHPIFYLTVRVTDNGSGNLYTEAVITITVTSPNSNHAPVIANQLFTINENLANGTTVGTVIASDPDVGQTLTYSILSGNTNSAFSINTSTGTIIVTNTLALNYEVNPTFQLVVKVQDNGASSLSSQATVTVNLVNLNEPPIIVNQSFYIAENSFNGTFIGTIYANDPDAGQTLTYSIISGNTTGAFVINSTSGTLIVANSAVLNYEANPSFTITVKVTDNGVGYLNNLANITIHLIDVNEPPTINEQTFSVNENALEGTIVGTVLASDPDAGQSLTYSIISGNSDDAFNIFPATGVLYVTNSLALDYETTQTFSLIVKVQDNSGNTPLFSQSTITISLRNIVEGQDGNAGSGSVTNGIEINPVNPENILVVDSILRPGQSWNLNNGNYHPTIYPNPSSGEINISFPKEETYPVTISILDQNGKVFYSDFKMCNSIVKLDLSKYPKGNYILSTNSVTNRSSDKFVLR